jgi:hypothetical protein
MDDRYGVKVGQDIFDAGDYGSADGDNQIAVKFRQDGADIVARIYYRPDGRRRIGVPRQDG